MHSKGWKINPKKIQRPIKSVMLLGMQWSKTHRDIPIKIIAPHISNK